MTSFYLILFFLFMIFDVIIMKIDVTPLQKINAHVKTMAAFPIPDNE
jgi:hypothetical protein